MVRNTVNFLMYLALHSDYEEVFMVPLGHLQHLLNDCEFVTLLSIVTMRLVTI
jgi:hypothetical protein